MLNVERKIFLEDTLENLKKIYSNKLEIYAIIFSEQLIINNELFTEIDKEYLIKALYMPIQELSEILDIYDKVKPKMDELKLIYTLSNYYNIDRNQIIKRLHEVRQINVSRNIKSKYRKKAKRNY